MNFTMSGHESGQPGQRSYSSDNNSNILQLKKMHTWKQHTIAFTLYKKNIYMFNYINGTRIRKRGIFYLFHRKIIFIDMTWIFQFQHIQCTRLIQMVCACSVILLKATTHLFYLLLQYTYYQTLSQFVNITIKTYTN